MSDYANIRVTIDGAVATVTIAREKALNALNAETLQELTRAFDELDENHAIRAVILTGAGEKAFVAGADIVAMVELNGDDAERFASIAHALGTRIESMHKPVIAAVNGFALGGGCEIALACDFIFASDRAKFGQPEVNLGVIPGFGGTQRLARRIGAARALELILTGDIINAEEALRIGLANRVVPGDQLMTLALDTAKKIATKAPLAVAAACRAVRQSHQLTLDEGNQLEQQLFGSLFETADQKEGMRAFLAKRPAEFKGE